MKKTFLMIVLVIIATSCKESGQKKTDLDELNLKGNIQSVFTLSYKAIDKFGEGNIVKGKLNSFDNEYICFDSIGNIVSKKTYYIKDIITDWLYEYDKNGYKIRNLFYDDNGQLEKYSSTFVNDSIGNPLIEIDDDKDKKYYTYNNGKLIKDGKPGYYNDYEYDKKGNLIVMRMGVGGYGGPMIWKFTYDSNNNLIRRDNSYADSYWEFKYNEQNQESEALMFEKNNSIKIKRKYWYNAKGDKCKYMSWNSEGLLTEEDKYYYLYEDTLIVTQLTIDKENLVSNLICNLYNSNNKIASQYGYKVISELFASYSYHYYDNLLNSINYQSDHSSWTENFYYDKNNKLIESKCIKDDNLTITKYDKEGRIVQNTEFDKANAIVKDIRIKYQGNNDKGTVEIIDKNIQDNTETKVKSTFDKELLVERIVQENNTENIFKYEYNEHNDLVKMINSKEKEFLTFKYKYDSKGNWTTKTIFNNEKPTEIQERLISYY